MFTPGAAIFTTGPKLLNGANESSATVSYGEMSSGPLLPQIPLLTPNADTVITLGSLAGSL